MTLDLPEDDRPALPMAALVDMVFLMIFYFLACGSLQPEQPAARVAYGAGPAGASTAGDTPPAVLVVRADSHLLLDGRDLGPATSADLSVLDASRPLVVTPDPAAPHGAVATALEAAARTGAQPTLR